MAVGCIPIVGFNIGARKYKRVKKLFSALPAAEAVVGAIALIVAEVFPQGLIGIFGAKNESIYYTEFAIRSFRVYLCMIVLACINKAAFIFLQAMGRAVESTMLSMVREIVFGVGFALLLPLFFGLDGVLYSMPVSDVLTAVVTAAVIVKAYRRLDRAEGEKDGIEHRIKAALRSVPHPGRAAKFAVLLSFLAFAVLGVIHWVSGALAISAMVLPGISGATLLLASGLYIPIISGIRGLMRLDFSAFLLLGVFGVGVITGIAVSFRGLNRLLTDHRRQVIYIVIGLMLGSLYAVVMGPTTLAEAQPAVSADTFDLIFFIIGLGTIFVFEAVKRKAEHKKLSPAVADDAAESDDDDDE